jgi:hypothetical protein
MRRRRGQVGLLLLFLFLFLLSLLLDQARVLASSPFFSPNFGGL